MKITFPTKVREQITVYRGRRPLLFLIIGLFFLILNVLITWFYPPMAPIGIAAIQIPALPLNISVLYCSLFFLGAYIFKSKSHGFLIASFVCVYLVFRLHNLTHPFFFILLSALFLTLELFVSYRK